MFFLLYGKDSLRSKQYLKHLSLEFKKKRDPQSLNTAFFDFEKEKSSEQFFNCALTPPFLAEKKFIAIANLLKSGDAKFFKDFLAKLNQIPETNSLIFWEEFEKPKAAAKEIFEFLKSQQYSQEFALLKGRELENWIAREIKERSGNIDRAALNFILDSFDDDMWGLNSLLDQLVAFADGAMIQKKDVEKFCSLKVDDNIFNLVDAVLAQNSRTAYEMIREQYRIGEDAQFIFAMILRQCKILLEIKDALARSGNLTVNELAGELGLHPFVAKKSMAILNRYSFDALKEMYNQLLELDIKTKTGQGDPSLLIDLFVGRVCFAK